ncbi:MAG: hypothetical protein IJW43_02805 [Clostridia bacterium]|nr:hypothetical protein [Clostridia bacterium]
MLLSSYIYGPIFLALGFLFCLVVVVGIKSVIFFIKSKLKEKFSPPKKEMDKKEKSAPKKSRTLEINAQDVDKIYFRKSS